MRSVRCPITSPISTAIVPARLYDLVLREVKSRCSAPCSTTPSGNQSQAAVILGITRGTLRKKLRQFGLRLG